MVMTGGLIPEESVVYDFSHDEEGLGLIMPFVRIEQVYFLITGRQEIRRSFAVRRAYSVFGRYRVWRRSMNSLRNTCSTIRST